MKTGYIEKYTELLKRENELLRELIKIKKQREALKITETKGNNKGDRNERTRKNRS